jgi:hypothetical protein
MAVELSYNISDNLKQKLSVIEGLRQKIILYPIPPPLELKLKWEANLARLFWSLSLSGSTLQKAQMQKIVTPPIKKRLKPDAREVVDYKKALDYIRYNWKLSPLPVTPNSVRTLYNISCKSTVKKEITKWSQFEIEIKNLLDYLQAGNENPVIQASIAQIELFKLRPFPAGNGKVARLLSLLFLYKYGYDVRDLLVISEYFRRDVTTLERITTSTVKRANLTIWLEYYADGIEQELSKTLQNIKDEASSFTKTKAYWRLNQRQINILSQLDSPGTSITNIQLRKMFKVSHMTAKRDLMRLIAFGIIVQRGKGRGIHYTRV